MSGPRRNQPGDRRRELRRIVLHAIDADETIETACQEFVLAAVHDLEKMSSCEECRAKILEMYGLALDLDEISWAASNLVKQGKLIESDQYRFLSEECRREIASRIREANEVEAAAFELWELRIRSRFPELGTEQHAELRDDLSTWIFWIVSQYGVETSVLCDPNQPRHELYVSEVRMRSDDLLPARGPLVTMIREDALMAFFEEIALVQRSYLRNLIASAYLMAVFTLDPDVVGGVRRLVNGQRLYLDTNQVYTLLGLNGPAKGLALRRLLSFALSLGYQVCVTPWTLEEMEASVRSARTRLMRRPPQSISYLRPDSDTDKKYIAAYRRAERDQGLSLEAFFNQNKDVRGLLRKETVDVVDDHCAEIDANEELIDAEITRLEQIRGGQEKPRPLQEHDVKLKLLIEYIRAPGPRRFSNMGALVLTNDHTMMEYAGQSEGGTGDLPFAISLKQWTSVMRTLVPRTESFDGSLTQMHEAPELGASEFIGQEELVKAIEEIRGKERFNAEKIMRNVVDSAFSDSPDQTGVEEAGPDDTVEVEALKRRTLELEAELEDLQRRTVDERRQTRKERTDSFRRLRSLESELGDAQRLLKESHLDQLRSRQVDRTAVSETTGKLADELVALETKLNDVEGRLRRNEFRVRWGGGALLAAGGLTCGSLTLFAEGFSNGWPLRGALVAGGAMIVGAFGWVFGKRRAGVLGSMVGLVLGVLASMQTLEKEESPRSQPSVTRVASPRHEHSSTRGTRSRGRGTGAARGGPKKRAAAHPSRTRH